MSRFFARLIPICAVVVVCIDGWLKTIALSHFPSDQTLINPSFFALALHKNYGIAFNIPLKLPLILLVSVLLGAGLIDVAWRNYHANPNLSAAAMLVIIGGCGNVYDRVAYGFTVDYLLIGDRTAINLSDLVILSGIVWLLFASRQSQPTSPSLTTEQK